MKTFTTVLTLFLIAGILVNSSESLSCYGGRGACITSCIAQNCATGYCIPPNKPPAQQTCTCSRCGNGRGPMPDININIGGRGGRR